MRNLQTQDIFSLARVLKEANVLEVVKNIDKTKDARQVGMTVIFGVIGNCAAEHCEEKIYKFLSGPFEMTEMEVRELDPEELIDKIFKVASIEKWKSFLSKASQFLK
ncbi:hypothetical protein [Clostridium celatum]|uniref:hypothetical protein n=1 Tax=Clostridium celatum TaxID=36834 RepID=UPI001899D127|nr:hypothetical protein [Clostridium celatum]